MGVASSKDRIAIGTAGILALLGIAVLYWTQRPPRPSELVEVPKPSATPRTILADDQKTKVELLLGEGKYEQALVESKRYYNVAALKDTADAVRLTALALEHTRGKDDPVILHRFFAEQAAGACDPSTAGGILSAIPTDAASYANLLESTSNAKSYDEWMTRGEALLLAGQPEQARRAFVQAAKLARVNHKQLFNAVEGVARSQRAEDGVSGWANALILALMLGDESAAAKAGLPIEDWPNGELQLAAQRVILRQLSRRQATDRTSSDGAPVTYDLGDPAVIASVAPTPDPALVEWLTRWQHQAATGGFSVSDDDQLELRKILARTEMPCLLLFHLAHAFQFRAGDEARTTSALFYKAAADRVEAELQQHGHSPRAVAILRGMKDHMGGYKSVLWPLIDAKDQEALHTLYTIYSNYARWTPPDDEAINRPLTHVKIGLAECLFLQRRYSEAQSLLDSLDTATMEKGEYLAYHWAQAMLYQYSGQIAKTIPHLEICSGDPTYKYARDALRLLFIAQIKLARVKDAQRTYESYADCYGSDRVTRYMAERLEAVASGIGTTAR